MVALCKIFILASQAAFGSPVSESTCHEVTYLGGWGVGLA